MNTRNQSRKLSLLLAAALVFSGCGTEAESTVQETSSAIAVKAVEAELGTMTVSNQFIGTVSPQQQVSVVPLVSGEVDAVYAEVGDEVKAGDVLFHIKDEAARLQKESAELSKQGAELSAQMQLGSAQVMNNISMQSNIRSLEYQLAMAKDQYDSAVNGIADAQDAKAEMNDAISQINSSVSSLQKDQKEMEEVVSEARKYVRYDISGREYYYEQVYTRPLDPDHYTWKDEMTETVPSVSEDEKDPNGNGEKDQLPVPGLPSLSGAGLDSYEKDFWNQGTDSSKNDVKETESGTADPAETPSDEEKPDDTEATQTKEPSSWESETADRDVIQENTSAGESTSAADETPAENTVSTEDDAPAVNAAPVEDDASEANPVPAAQSHTNGSGESAADPDETAYAAELAGHAYFSAELIREDTAWYLAAEEEDSYLPKLKDTTKEEAWQKYREQQKIDAARRKANEMGYSAEDIGRGKAAAELLENSVQIVTLQYQASELQSNQATMDSSIKSAESAKDTTAKTIDFYEDNLENAQVTYGISNGQAYQDTAGALATQIQAADVGVRSAQMQLEYYSPTTPISGTVVSKTVEQYGLVQPGYAAYVISNQDAMNVTFAVSGQVKESLQIGMPVTLEKSGSTYTGTITEIGETVDQQSGGLFLVKAITEADGDKLAGGTAVKLTVDTFRAENAVLIPYDAVHFESEQAYVYAIMEHKAVRTPVTVGLMNDDMVEITEGLAAGTQVVATWSSQLEDGAEVRVIGESRNAAAKAAGSGSVSEKDETDSGTARETQNTDKTDSETLSGEAGEAEE